MNLINITDRLDNSSDFNFDIRPHVNFNCKCLTVSNIIDLYDYLDNDSRLIISNIVPKYENYYYSNDCSCNINDYIFSCNSIKYVDSCDNKFHNSTLNIKTISKFACSDRNKYAKILLSVNQWNIIRKFLFK